MTSEDDGYVHTPGDDTAVKDGVEHGVADSGVEHDNSETAVEDGTPAAGHPAATDREFDWRGWILVATLFVAFVVAPVTIYLIPPGAEMYLTVLIVMPLLPALLLAAVAVWATTRP